MKGRTGCRLCWGSALGVILSLAGCGPITSTTAIVDANRAIAEARAAGAEQRALYELTSADEYLHKAREEEGFSDFQAAIDLARKAREFAAKARERAQGGAATEGAPAAPTQPGAPAPSDPPAGSRL